MKNVICNILTLGAVATIGSTDLNRGWVDASIQGFSDSLGIDLDSTKAVVNSPVSGITPKASRNL